jgi:6-phosphogluconate dehydrogenase
MTSNIGLIGLAVMGENLVLNMESKGFSVAVYNRTTSKVDDFVNGRGKDKHIVGCHSVEDLIANLESPRKIMIMVKAGGAVDAVINQLVPLLDKGDVLIDGGNTHFPDTDRRVKELTEKGIHYIGTGVSGGEEGALHGPSIMPGGSPEAWPLVKDILQAISAKAEDGSPCCEWVGDGGAGHFVKMVHNGIEYGDMQLLCESYDVLKQVGGLSNDDLHKTYSDWNNTELKSYLVEITRDIFAKKEDGEYVVDKILDTAGQKGTGKWTGVVSLELGMPVTLIAEAVYARTLSAQKDARVRASKVLSGPDVAVTTDRTTLISNLKDAVYAAKIISYAQGFVLMQAAAKEFGWTLNYPSIAALWREGCIIRSSFLQDIMNAFSSNPELENLFLDDFFKDAVSKAQTGWRKSISLAVENGIPVPAISSALAYYDGYRTARLPANLLQAQRDFFGAHTYERIDKPRGDFFHTNWTGKGGNTTSNQYDV